MPKTPKSVPDLKAQLAALKNKDKGFKTEINIFDAVGMQLQETKHSYFLGYLLDSNRPHGLGDEILKAFLDEVINKNTVRGVNGLISASALETVESSWDKTKITVTREKETDKNRRMDVLIDIPLQDNDTVVVIENKVNATLLKDQLSDYYDYICNRSDYKGYKNKIFVFLTIDGHSPSKEKCGTIDDDKNWCIFSYQDIINIIEKVFKQQPVKSYIKKMGRDYIRMANNCILNKNDICWELVSKYSPEIERLHECIKNKKKNLKYCKDWLEDNIKGLKIAPSAADASFNFSTQAIRDYFTKIDGSYQYKKCSWFVGSTGGIQRLLDLFVVNGAKTWSKAQNEILLIIGSEGPNGHGTAYSTKLLTNEEWIEPLSEIQSKLDTGLNALQKAVERFDDKLLQLLTP